MIGQNPYIGSIQKQTANKALNSVVTLKFGQGYRNLITFSPHPNNVSLADLSKSMHWFTRYTADKAHFHSFNNVVTMKIGSRSPNSDQIVYLFIYPNDTTHEAWSESIIWFKSLGADKLLLSQNLTFKVPMWTWKWGQRHQNLNTFFLLYQRYFYASLVKVHLFVQKIECWQCSFLQSL